MKIVPGYILKEASSPSNQLLMGEKHVCRGLNMCKGQHSEHLRTIKEQDGNIRLVPYEQIGHQGQNTNKKRSDEGVGPSDKKSEQHTDKNTDKSTNKNTNFHDNYDVPLGEWTFYGTSLRSFFFFF